LVAIYLLQQSFAQAVEHEQASSVSQAQAVASHTHVSQTHTLQQEHGDSDCFESNAPNA
jgi:hypothetical protein